MIDTLDKGSCFGCGACLAACPKKCIEMIEDSEGFFYPKIDMSKCIHCGMCEKVCIANKEEKMMCNNVAYIAYSCDESVRNNSSSGGIFFELANKVIENGGIVAGCVYDKGCAKHILVDSKRQIQPLMRSKYIQSECWTVYETIREKLNKGMLVLFSGTECQIVGLKSFLGKKYEKLITVDVLCHGVPSKKVLHKYIKDKCNCKGISDVENVDVNFRSKKVGWRNFSIELNVEGELVSTNVFNNDSFFTSFLKHMCLRPSCHECKFKNINRLSDITLGDCWYIENFDSNLDDDKGLSVVIVHSDIGNDLYNSLKNVVSYKVEDVDLILPKDADSRVAVTPHKNRKKFMSNIDSDKSLDELITKYYIKGSVRGTVLYYLRKFKWQK